MNDRETFEIYRDPEDGMVVIQHTASSLVGQGVSLEDALHDFAREVPIMLSVFARQSNLSEGARRLVAFCEDVCGYRLKPPPAALPTDEG